MPAPALFREEQHFHAWIFMVCALIAVVILAVLTVAMLSGTEGPPSGILALLAVVKWF